MRFYAAAIVDSGIPFDVLFGKTAQVKVGGLVASTLDISDADFWAGRFKFGLGGQRDPAAVINQGKITAKTHGAVALLGGDVSNEGKVSAHLGVVALAAGNAITLNLAGDDNLQVVINEPALNASVLNSGNLAADGGRVWMTAGATDALLQTVINNTGHIQARTVGDSQGQIRLWGLGEGTVAQVSGTVDAGADQGDGGTISIQGSNVKILAGTHITTLADTGETGELIVQASQLRLSADGSDEAGSQIDADTLTDTLTRSHVRLYAEEGDIQVDAPVNWSQNQLSLDASHSININATMTASGTASLEMAYGGHGSDPNTILPGSGVNMGLSADGFTGRVEFKDVLDQRQTENLRLMINGEAYTLLTQVGGLGSTSKVDLQGIDGRLDGKYALAADIDAAEAKKFKPIGSDKKPFSGRFEGLGNQIANLSIDRREESHVGLFAASSGSIRNLALTGGSVKGAHNAQVIAGSVVGELMRGGGIVNVHTTTPVHADSDRGASAKAIAGGVAGKILDANLSNAYAHGEVKAHAFSRGSLAYSAAGGAAGQLQDGTLASIHAAGPVTVSAISRRLQPATDERGAPIFDQSKPPVYVEGTATSYAGGAIGVKNLGHVERITATGNATDVSTGNTSVSTHPLIGNDPLATRGKADTLRREEAKLVALSQAAAIADMAIDLPEPVSPAVSPAIVSSIAAMEEIPVLALAGPQSRSVANSISTAPAPAAHAPPPAGPAATATPVAKTVSAVLFTEPVRSAPPKTPVSVRVHMPANVDAMPAKAFDSGAAVGVSASANDMAATVHVAPAPVAAGVGAPAVDSSAPVMDIAAAKEAPGAAAAPLAAAQQSRETAPRVRVESLAPYAAVMATLRDITRAAPAPAAQPTSEEPLYTVIDNGIHLPAR